jgi:hypothetical protein
LNKFRIIMNDLIEDIGVFDVQEPEIIRFADNIEDWPYIRIDIGGGIYNPIAKVGEFFEEVSRDSGYKFINLMEIAGKDIALSILEIFCPQNGFFHKSFNDRRWYRTLRRTYLLEPNSPKKKKLGSTETN